MSPSRRIAVVGTSGSGKSTLASEVAARLGCDHIELDSIYHQQGWTPINRNEMRAAVSARITADSWVVDGNYQSVVQDLVLPAADTVVWLDLPRRIVMSRVIRRSLKRAATRQELWNGNRERFSNLLKNDPEENIILWSWAQHAKYHSRYAQAMADPANAHLEWVQITSPHRQREWLAGLE